MMGILFVAMAHLLFPLPSTYLPMAIAQHLSFGIGTTSSRPKKFNKATIV